MIKFIKIYESDIEKAEELLGLSIPNSLKRFYLRYGYGNIPSHNGYNTNLFMHPITVANFRLGIDEFEFLPDKDIYSEYYSNKLVFFEANESTFFAVDINSKDEKVYYWDKVIANSIQEFIVKIIDDEDYYLDITK